MAFVQWRRYQFFDKQSVNSDALHELRHLSITCSTSGRGRLVFGDGEGFVHVFDRQLKFDTFRAYDRCVWLLFQPKHSNTLVTVGEDADEGEARLPLVRVWSFDKLDQTGKPMCMRTIKLAAAKFAGVQPTTISVLEDLTQLAIGFTNGAVILVRGDLVRDRFSKQKLIQSESGEQISFLGFRRWNKLVILYVVSPDRVLSFRTNLREIVHEELDTQGCALGAATLGEDSDLVVGRDEAVYFYEPDGRGPCFAFESTDKKLAWFRSYLVVVGTPDTGAINKTRTINIYDLKNKFIAFSGSFSDVAHLACEWGLVLAITGDGNVFQLEEKDTHTKLELLFRKNSYQVAIHLAQSQSQDEALIVDIYRKYGDHLYGKRDYDGAMAQYLKTVGRLEPSYVIRKYLDAQRIHNLTSYLQVLHRSKLATADHTTLLLNCYTKLKSVQQLDDFIKTDSNLHFDVETAIKVLRQANYHEHSLFLARKNLEHDWYLRIQLDDIRDYKDALEYIAKLDFLEAEKNLKAYGKTLVTEMPRETTELLIGLCTGEERPSQQQQQQQQGTAGAMEVMVDPPLRLASHPPAGSNPMNLKARPEEFIHIYVDQPHWLALFLEYMIDNENCKSTLVYNTLFELYLREDNGVGDKPASVNTDRETRVDKAMQLLMNDQANYDVEHVLGLSQMHQFKPGMLFLYERLKLYREIIQYYMENDDYDNVLQACRQYGTSDPNLWIHVLTYFAGKNESCHKEIAEILDSVDSQNLLPPLLVVQILASKSTATLSVIQDYIVRRLQHENKLIQEDHRQIRNYKAETEKMRAEIEGLRTEAKLFQLTKCSACANPLDLPAIHFLCGHSFHQRCMMDTEAECVVCAPNNRKVLEVKRALEQNAGDHDQFFKQLEGSADGFSTVAEYFGRGIFNKVILLDGMGGPAGARAATGPSVNDRDMLFG